MCIPLLIINSRRVRGLGIWGNVGVVVTLFLIFPITLIDVKDYDVNKGSVIGDECQRREVMRKIRRKGKRS